VTGWVEVQQKAIERWAEHASRVADLIANGNLSPAAWVREYATMWQGMTKDAAELLKVTFSRGEV
jgi:hypothetical protein